MKRELEMGFGWKSGLLNLLAFFLIICALFPLGVGTDKVLLVHIAPAVILIAILLTTTLSLQSLFEPDHEDGTLEQYLLLPCLPSHIFLAKTLSNWFLAALPLIILTPLLGIIYGLNENSIREFLIILLIATPTISLIGTMSAALALGARKNNMIFSILALPLYIPTLVFAVGNSTNGTDTTGFFALIGIFFVTLPIAAIAGALSLSRLYKN